MPYYPEKKPAEPDKEPESRPESEQKPEKVQAYRRLWPALLCVSSLLVIYGAVRLIGYGADLSASRNTGRELQQIYTETETASEEPAEETAVPAPPTLTAFIPEETPAPAPESRDSGTLQAVSYPDNPSLKVSDRFLRLRKKSGYIIGWLTLDGVDEAVALKDNDFFLNHDAMGKKNGNGAIFLDAGTNLLTRPYTIYLYGHNMKSGHMFGRLKKYLERDYYYRNRLITFDSLYEDGRFAVFAAAKLSTIPGNNAYFDLWSLNTNNREEREKAIRRLAAKSPYDTLLDVQADEQILLLVTCIDEDTDRLVVAARRLRKGETEDSLNLRRQ